MVCLWCMRIDRFFVNNQLKEGEVVNITDPDVVHQWRKVLRYSPGTSLELCDNSGYVFAGVLRGYDKGAEVEISERREGNVLKPLTLYMSLIKKDKFELVCEKATELGVTRIVPITTEYSLEYNLRFDRLEKIIKEASEQSERAVLPIIEEIKTLQEAIEEAPKRSVVLVERTEGGSLKGAEALFVGPEGGWSEKEIQTFERKVIEKVSLGSQILRAETAGIVGIARATM